MNIFTRTFVVAAAACLLAALFVPALGSDAAIGDHPVDVADALAASSHDALAQLSIAKLRALTDVLGGVTDEQTARNASTVAERKYLELELLTARLRMLPEPTRAEQAALATRSKSFDDARAELMTQLQRIGDASPLALHLRSVTSPLNEQFQVLAVREANSLASLLQTLRSQVELYKLQHRETPPDFRNNGWKQLTERTDAKGALAAAGEFGPYLQAPPRNPRTKKSAVLVTRVVPKNGFHYDRGDCGFVFEESTGRFWALDADGRLFDERAAAAAPPRAALD